MDNSAHQLCCAANRQHLVCGGGDLEAQAGCQEDWQQEDWQLHGWATWPAWRRGRLHFSRLEEGSSSPGRFGGEVVFTWPGWKERLSLLDWAGEEFVFGCLARGMVVFTVLGP